MQRALEVDDAARGSTAVALVAAQAGNGSANQLIVLSSVADEIVDFVEAIDQIAQLAFQVVDVKRLVGPIQLRRAFQPRAVPVPQLGKLVARAAQQRKLSLFAKCEYYHCLELGHSALRGR